MNLRLPKNLSELRLDILFYIAAIVLFLPVFLTTFSAHTDGFFILTKKGNWLGDPEAGVMFLQGRPLGALTNSFVGWFIHRAEDLTWLRMAVFGILLLSSRLVYFICRRDQLSILWSYWLSFAFILLPSNILHVIWVANGIPESLGALFGILSYFFLYNSLGRLWGWHLALSGACFLIGLLMYQPMAMVVFAFILIKVLWNKEKGVSSMRLSFIQETFFYCFLMGLYWLLVKLVVLPLGLNVLGLNPTMWQTYKMELTTDLWAKMPLIFDTLKYGFLGVFDPVIHKKIFLQVVLMLIFLGGVGALLFQKKMASFNVSKIYSGVEKILFFAILFFCSNAPSLMAVNCTEVMGYRTLLPAAFMGLLVIAYFFNSTQDAFTEPNSKKIVKGLIIIYSLFMLVVAAWAINQNVGNNRKAYIYVDQLASRMDYSKTKNVVLATNTPLDFTGLPFEMGYMATTFQYVFDKYNGSSNNPVHAYESFSDWPLFFDQYTQVVDLTVLNKKTQMTGKKVYISFSGRDTENVSFSLDHLDSEFPVINFQQSIGSGKTIPYWLIPSSVNTAFVNLNFINQEQLLFAYRLNAQCSNAKGEPSIFGFKWQALTHENQWIDVSSLTWSHLGEVIGGQTFYNIEPKAYIRFRLMLVKANPQDNLVFASMQFVNFSQKYLNKLPKE